MMYTINARQINNTATADGYTDWEAVGEWEADTADDAIFFWMDQQPFEDSRFEQTGESTYRLDDAEFEVTARRA
jgi:hypothetical protein